MKPNKILTTQRDNARKALQMARRPGDRPAAMANLERAVVALATAAAKAKASPKKKAAAKKKRAAARAAAAKATIRATAKALAETARARALDLDEDDDDCDDDDDGDDDESGNGREDEGEEEDEDEDEDEQEDAVSAFERRAPDKQSTKSKIAWATLGRASMPGKKEKAALTKLVNDQAMGRKAQVSR